MKKYGILFFVTFVISSSYAQNVYLTRSGQVSFHSKTPIEDIDAINNEVTSLIDGNKFELAFAVLVKSFRFEKALMEEHFNENYLESNKYPKATFQGKISDQSTVNFKQNGSYTVTVDGDLTIHGVKRPYTMRGTITVTTGKLSVVSEFLVKPSDFGITIPALVSGKIAESISVHVNCQYEPK